MYIDEHNRDRTSHIEFATRCFNLTIPKQGSNAKYYNK